MRSLAYHRPNNIHTRKDSAIIALLTVVVASTAACGSTETPAVSQSIQTPAATPSAATPSVEAPSRPTDAVYVDWAWLDQLPPGEGDRTPMLWRGGMVGGSRQIGLGGTYSTDDEADATALFWGWVPGMDEVGICNLPLWKDNEFPAGNTRSQDIAATTSNKPVVAVIYSSTTESSGLTPREDRVWLQTLNLETCDLGPRIDVPGAHDRSSAHPRFVSASDEVLAVAGMGDDDGSLLFGINPTSGQLAWRHSFPDQHLEVQTTFEEWSGGDPRWGEPWGDGMVQFKHRAWEGEETQLIWTKDGSEIFAVGDATCMGSACLEESLETPGLPQAQLGEGIAVFTVGDVSCWYGCEDSEWEKQQALPTPHQIIYDGQTYTSISGGWFRSSGPPASDGQGGMILVGRYCPANEDCYYGEWDGMGWIGADGIISQILTPEQEEAVTKVLGVSNGLIYLVTTDQNIVINLDGEQVGTAYDPMEFPYAPVGEHYIDGVLWTLWESSISDSAEGYAITRDGIHPPAASLSQH